METIEPIAMEGASNNNGQWMPIVGDETLALLQHKGFASPGGDLTLAGQQVLEEALRILGACISPQADGTGETGLVLGYVQSGKTLSFTTVTALARDNGYQLIIIIAGASTNLFEQSTTRIRRDLQLDDRSDRQWIALANPGTIEDKASISQAVRRWANPSVARSRCSTILVTVMKQRQYLAKLANLLVELDATRIPTLIIDDEGDQASMNTRARAAARANIRFSESEWSTIYRRINELRDVLPHHTYLQYTATPQAPLFINIMDRLSPNFIRLLTPGEDYAGGLTFFVQHPNLVRSIPQGDIGTAEEPLQLPPASLREALQVFFVGVAVGLQADAPGNRSMMVHPSRLQDDHSQYVRFVNSIVNSWRRLLESTLPDDQDDREILLAEFHQAHRDLSFSADGIVPFDMLTGQGFLNEAVSFTRIIELNSRNGKTPQIPWKNEYSFILIGGQAMDRGFTVEGLTVTYMPRGIGTGNVDTIQQRARFFGYKRPYLGYCRVYVDQLTIDSYEAIVRHEEAIRESLKLYDTSDLPLNDWTRRAVLDDMLNLTRQNVLYDELERHQFGNDWFYIKAPHETERYVEQNRAVIRQFVGRYIDAFIADMGDPRRTEEQTHLTAALPLAECVDLLLKELKFTRERDSAEFTSFKSIMKIQLETNPSELCQVYLMSTQTTNVDSWPPRTRRLTAKGELQQLFQGANARTGYPGDREIKMANTITIQVYMLSIRGTDHERVPTISIWVPERMTHSLVSQTQSVA